MVTSAVGWHADRVASLMSAEGAHEQPPQDALDWIAVEADNLRATWRAGEAIGAWNELARLMDNICTIDSRLLPLVAAPPSRSFSVTVFMAVN